MSGVPVVIGGSMTIERVAEIQVLMQNALTQLGDNRDIELDFGEAMEFDGAGLQLLLTFSRTARQMGARLHLINMTSAVSAIVTRFNVADRFTRMESV